MSLYTIADLHLSTHSETNKSMEVFGTRWMDYIQRISDNFKKLVTDSDTVVIPGDISWALSLDEAVSDLKFIDSLPGKKILGKGNHDFWWCTMKKHEQLFKKLDIKTISFLFNNAHETDEFIIAGTRGWYNDSSATNAPSGTNFDKLTERERLRLKMSLDAAMALKERSPEKEILTFMHFPPVWCGQESGGLVELLSDYGVKRVYFGHIHGNYSVEPSFEHKGITMHLVSADYLKFIPKIVK